MTNVLYENTRFIEYFVFIDIRYLETKKHFNIYLYHILFIYYTFSVYKNLSRG